LQSASGVHVGNGSTIASPRNASNMACQDMTPVRNYWQNGSCLSSRSHYTQKKFEQLVNESSDRIDFYTGGAFKCPKHPRKCGAKP
jgi:hypothetical protein